MSRQEQFTERKQSPVQATVEFKNGAFSVYDKEQGNIPVNELGFVLLGEKSCINGYYAAQNTSAWSNEISDTTKEPLTVMYKKDGKVSTIIKGLYKDIKGDLEGAGLKFHKAVYALVYSSDEIADGTLVKILLKGAALYSWSQFRDDGGAKQGIKFAGTEDKQNGAIKYKVPLFESEGLEEAVAQEGELAYEQVKAYLMDAPVQKSEPEGDDPLA